MGSDSGLKTKMLGKSRLSNQDQRHLNRAITLAALGTMRQKHGAVIVAGGRVVSVGINTYRNDPRTVGNSDPLALSVHAEHSAIKAMGTGFDFRGMTMFTARLSATGNPAYSRPCSVCWSRLARLGFKEIVHT